MGDLNQWIQVVGNGGSLVVMAIVLWLFINGQLFTKETVDRINQAADARIANFARELSERLAKEVGEQTKMGVERALQTAIERWDPGGRLDPVVTELRAELADVRAALIHMSGPRSNRRRPKPSIK